MKLLDISTPMYPNTFTMVDDADYEWLNQWKWHPSPGSAFLKRVCVRRSAEKPSKAKISMSRFILGAGSGDVVDHADGNTLNNQRENLRFATLSQNAVNKRMKPPRSGYRGVCFVADYKYRPWRAVIRNAAVKRGGLIYLGWFATAEEAAQAYNDAATKYFGPFPKLNKIPAAKPSTPLTPKGGGRHELQHAAR